MAAGVGTIAWAYRCRHDYRIREYTVEALPPDAEPIRILHISDLHLLSGDVIRRGFVAGLAAFEPDLVINTGDNHADRDAWAAVVDALGPLLDRPGVFVWGSNDYHAPGFRNPAAYLLRPSTHVGAPVQRPDMPYERLGAEFTKRGWHDLNHARVRVEINGTHLELRGTDDAHHDRDDYSLVSGPVAADADLAIGVTHAPYRRVLDGFAGDGFDLIFAGHTHGGQVCLPGGRALITNCDLEPARVKGLAQHTFVPEPGDERPAHTSVLHVSGGLGTSPYAPYRLFCPPEAALLTLVPRP